MTTKEAIQFIQSAIPTKKSRWADIGAGSGTFTLALDQLLLPESTIYAIDKEASPLRQLTLKHCQLEIVKQDFNQKITIPPVDGLLMANALHYSPSPLATLEKLLEILKPNGTFLLIEYELDKPRGPWIPYPIPFKSFQQLATDLPLTVPEEKARVTSAYGNNYMYLAHCQKTD